MAPTLAAMAAYDCREVSQVAFMSRLLTWLSTVNLRHYSIAFTLAAILTGAGTYFAQDIERILLGAATMVLLLGAFTSLAGDVDDGPGGSGAHV
jgi:hypothetical protein